MIKEVGLGVSDMYQESNSEYQTMHEQCQGKFHL